MYVLTHGKRPITRPPRNKSQFAIKAQRKDVMKQNKLSSCSAKHCDCLTALNCNAIHMAIHYADADYDCGKEGGWDGAMEGKEEEKGYKDPAGSDY